MRPLLSPFANFEVPSSKFVNGFQFNLGLHQNLYGKYRFDSLWFSINFAVQEAEIEI
jgi:hypothetical protein